MANYDIAWSNSLQHSAIDMSVKSYSELWLISNESERKAKQGNCFFEEQGQNAWPPRTADTDSFHAWKRITCGDELA